jgi:Ran GTPase-activating protein (RanGAP) involved in mRNA processing and transport
VVISWASDKVATALARALRSNSTLRSLDLSGNAIEAAGAKELAEMRRNNSSLESLNMLAGKCPCGRRQGAAELHCAD